MPCNRVDESQFLLHTTRGNHIPTPAPCTSNCHLSTTTCQVWALFRDFRALFVPRRLGNIVPHGAAAVRVVLARVGQTRKKAPIALPSYSGVIAILVYAATIVELCVIFATASEELPTTTAVTFEFGFGRSSDKESKECDNDSKTHHDPGLDFLLCGTKSANQKNDCGN
jgi:hypothetical protein